MGDAAGGVAAVLLGDDGPTHLGDTVEAATQALPCQHAQFDLRPAFIQQPRPLGALDEWDLLGVPSPIAVALGDGWQG